MSNYSYVAVNPQGMETRGCIDVADQSEALRRIKEMGLFPTKLIESRERCARPAAGPRRNPVARVGSRRTRLRFGAGISPAALTVLTRQLATLVEAGMPLVRSLRTLQEQEERRPMKRLLEGISMSIEDGSSLSEAVGRHPRVFNALYLNMVRAGEIGGALEITLKRLADFMEKAQKLRGRVKAALCYPCAVLLVALGILGILAVFVVPKFRMVFDGLLDGAALPWFTLRVFNACEMVKNHVFMILIGAAVLSAAVSAALKTECGGWACDRLKLCLPVLGPLFRKAAISRFARTLGTLASNGVPILQALHIVKETAGNRVYGQVVARIHDSVKQGDPIAPALKGSSLFPSMVAGMVDVGEQTGALPEMLIKIADNYDEEVDNAANALTSLLEPIMIVFLAVVVGSIVIAMFLPLITIADKGIDPSARSGAD